METIEKSPAFSEEVSEEESSDGDNYSENDERRGRRRIKKGTKKSKEPYPTKNFLPAFRSPILNYLKKFYDPKFFESIRIVDRIKHKKCINLKDF